jgi:hypothetical protein
LHRTHLENLAVTVNDRVRGTDPSHVVEGQLLLGAGSSLLRARGRLFERGVDFERAVFEAMA